MRLITRKGPFDCGVCAVATICGVTWKTARHAIWPKTKVKTTYGTFSRELVKAARRLGFRSPRFRLTVCATHRWKDVPPRSIVKVVPKVCRGTQNWHWVVWDGKYVLNAQRGKRYSRPPYRPESYLVIQRKPK